MLITEKLKMHSPHLMIASYGLYYSNYGLGSNQMEKTGSPRNEWGL